MASPRFGSADWQNSYRFAGARPTHVVDPTGLWGNVTFKDCGVGEKKIICPAEVYTDTIEKWANTGCAHIENAIVWLESIGSMTWGPNGEPIDKVNPDKLKEALEASDMAIIDRQYVREGYLKLLPILRAARERCKAGITFECHFCCTFMEALEGNLDPKVATVLAFTGRIPVPFGGYYYLNIHLCLQAFCKATMAQREATILHEITHYGGSGHKTWDATDADILEWLVPRIARQRKASK